MDLMINGEAALLAKLSPFGFRVIFDVGAGIGEWLDLARATFPDQKLRL